MVGLGNFNPRTGKKWNNTHKTATPKVKKGVVQAAVAEDSKSDGEGKETVLLYYTQILKARRFIDGIETFLVRQEEEKAREVLLAAALQWEI